MKRQHLALLAVLAVCGCTLLCYAVYVMCVYIVDGTERQMAAAAATAGSQCGDTLFLSFSSGLPKVQCPSCSDEHTQAAAGRVVLKREPRLELYGLLVRQEYGEDGSLTCSLVEISDHTLIPIWYSCGSGFRLYNQSCYHVSSTEGSWHDGRHYCSSLGSKYVTITSDDEFNFVKSLLSADTWIGLTDIDEEGRYVWDADGSDATFLKFDSDQPNDQDWSNFFVQDCVEMRGSRGFLWHDIPCYGHRRFACEVSATIHRE